MDRIVVVGASAGGVEALRTVAAGLPGTLGVPVVMVLHVPAETSLLPHILMRAGSPPARHPEDGDTLEPGTIYVAPPDRHLLVRGGRACVVRGPSENGHRPAIDPTFRSAALAFGPGTVAVVLTGTGDDGSVGAAAVAARGGTVLAQEPGDALYPAMPENALLAVPTALRAPLAEIAPAIVRAAASPRSGEPNEFVEEDFRLEESFAMFDRDAITNNSPPGDPAGLGCPACGGALWEVEDEAVLRFRCRVGHAYSSESLFDAGNEQLETALWSALRALEERGDLSRRMARRLRRRGVERRAGHYEAESSRAERSARVIREMLLTRNGGADAA